MRASQVLILCLLALAAVWRLIPHPDNMTPVMAVALFAGIYLQQTWLRLAAPIVVLLVSDVLLGFHETMPFVYGAMLLPALFGPLLRGRGVSFYAGASVTNSLIFFLVTNAGVWLVSGMYSLDLAGLLQSLTMALPFLWKTIAGDLFFTLLFLAAFMLLGEQDARFSSAVDRSL